MTEFSHTAVIGAGVIGASWASLFLASGRSVAVFDPAPQTETMVKQTVENVWPVLEKLDLTAFGNPNNITFHDNLSAAVEGAAFVQESVPERIEIKHALYREIESLLEPDVVVASSASGLTLSEMQTGWNDPGSLVLGHPFNPPHLIPILWTRLNRFINLLVRSLFVSIVKFRVTLLTGYRRPCGAKLYISLQPVWHRLKMLTQLCGQALGFDGQ